MNSKQKRKEKEKEKERRKERKERKKANICRYYVHIEYYWLLKIEVKNMEGVRYFTFSAMGFHISLILSVDMYLSTTCVGHHFT